MPQVSLGRGDIPHPVVTRDCQMNYILTAQVKNAQVKKNNENQRGQPRSSCLAQIMSMAA